MIQANELRIGNWYDHNGSYRQVTPNTIEEVWEGERIYVNPIPLTPEILEKCGFEPTTDMPNEYFIRLSNGIDKLIVCNGKVTVVIFGSRILTSWYNHVNSLHQLQNLYFALTGKELNVQL